MKSSSKAAPLLIICLILGFGIWLAIKSEVDHGNLDPNVVVQLGEQTLAVPRAYFLILPSKDNKSTKSNGINLEYIMPSFEPARNADLQLKKVTTGQTGRLLLRAVDAKTPLAKDFDFRQNLSGAGKRVAEHNGLVEYTDRGDAKQRRTTIYIARDGSGITDIIECYLDGIVKLPSCNHRFEDDGLEYKISYNRDRFFADWRQHRTKMVALVKKWENSKTPEVVQ